MKQIGLFPPQTKLSKSIELLDVAEQKTLVKNSSCSLNLFLLEGEVYLRVVPGKKLFRSTMIHSVVNRGDIFAVRLSDSVLTIIPGKSLVIHQELELTNLNNLFADHE